jgi:hypothetical protein
MVIPSGLDHHGRFIISAVMNLVIGHRRGASTIADL